MDKGSGTHHEKKAKWQANLTDPLSANKNHTQSRRKSKVTVVLGHAL